MPLPITPVSISDNNTRDMNRLTTSLMVAALSLLGIVSCKTREKDGGFEDVYGPPPSLGLPEEPQESGNTYEGQPHQEKEKDGTTGASMQQRQ